MVRKLERECPKCGKLRTFSNKSNYNRAKNILCKHCTHLGYIVTEKTRRKISENNSRYWAGKSLSADIRQKMSSAHLGQSGLSGKDNPMYGKSVYDVWCEKYGKTRAKEMWVENRRKAGEKMRGNNNPSKRLEVKKKLRIAAINRLQSNGISISYNHLSIPIIEKYGKQNGYNFQHAENGGEVCIDGYYPDGVDLDKKVIIEVDEKYHFNSGEKRRKKDKERQKFLENLGYKVIRIKFNDR